MEKHQQSPDVRLDAGPRTKQWNPKFEENRRLIKLSFQDALKRQNNKLKFLDAFLRYAPSSVPSLQGDDVKDFFASDQAVSTTTSLEKRAWIDNRIKFNGESVCHSGLMTATDLGEVLYQQWLGAPLQSEVNRLLIHVVCLTPDYARFMVQNVAYPGINALRDALRGHMARDIALRVSIQPKGSLLFQLELHLPYLILRSSQKPDKSDASSEATTFERDPWYDASFLQPRPTDTSCTKPYAIYDAHTSIVISGSDRCNYTGYAFLDPGSTEHHFKNDETHHKIEEVRGEDEDVDEEGEPVDLEPVVDYFTTDGRGQFRHADDPVWDPRVLFLLAVETRVRLALEEYQYLTQNLGRYIRAWMKENMGLTAGLSTGWTSFQSPLCHEQLSDYITHTTQLVQQVQAYLSKTIGAWQEFQGLHGDIQYFSDLSDPVAIIAICGIRSAFTKLAQIKSQLAAMEDSCKGAASTLETRLATRNNAITQRALDLNAETSRLSKRATDLAATSQELAITSLQAAKETSQITRISVYLLLVTSPFIIALQYFTSESKLFPFERTPRVFFLSTGVLMLLLLGFVLAFYGVDAYRSVLFWKVYGKMGGQRDRLRRRMTGTNEAENS